MSLSLREQVIAAVKQLPEERLPIANRIQEFLATSDKESVVNLAKLPDIAMHDGEAEWEEAVLMETLGDALRPDGSIDYSKLKLVEVSIDELA